MTRWALLAAITLLACGCKSEPTRIFGKPTWDYQRPQDRQENRSRIAYGDDDLFGV